MDGESSSSSWPAETAGSWFVIRTRPRHERILARDLRARGVAHFLPLVRAAQVYGGYQASVELPVFPTYLFLRGELDDVHTAHRTDRVAEVIPVPDQSQLDAELRNVHAALLADAPLAPVPYVRAGVRARVREGPFAGLHGVLDDVTRRDRIILQVQALGRAVSLELQGSAVEVME